MVLFIVLVFLGLGLGLSLFMSYTLRLKLMQYFNDIRASLPQKYQRMRVFLRLINQAASDKHTQQYWHLQQWWILLAGVFLFSSILLFAFNRPITANKIEADYLKAVDPQIYQLLNGEILTPPPTVDEQLINAAIIESQKIESAYAAQNTFNQPTDVINAEINNDVHAQLNTQLVSRKWDRMNPRYKQRLLMVFKIMKQQYQYDLVLLEGYRSPERQNMLAGNANTTRAQAYQSYHQFGLAADIAFMRDGKIIISERDPWAMRAYQRYGEVAESVGLTWGGRWTSIQDYGHSEYRMPGLKKTAAMAEQLSLEGQLQVNAK